MRAILIVMDSVGIGALPDAEAYGDGGSNTLAHTAEAVGGLNLPVLTRLGLGNLGDIKGVPTVSEPAGGYGKMAEKSAGKDTTTGHWEMTGIILEQPFPTYPQGFPEDLISKYEKQIGRRVLGNKAASGTAIIAELGTKHLASGCPIVYTSADSVFQIAAHEAIIPLEELYRMCRIARRLLQGEHGVGRVIARPFVGEAGNFTRTANRRDFSLEPPSGNLLELLQVRQIPVYAVGKIEDIFAGQGISEAVHTQSNLDGLEQTLAFMDKVEKGLIFTNLVDFDMLYGHRNNPAGYAQALEELDQYLQKILNALQPEDILLITADHGCDPTTTSTDHSREYVPILAYGQGIRQGVNLGIRSSFADLGATIAEIWGLQLAKGTSFWPQIKK